MPLFCWCQHFFRWLRKIFCSSNAKIDRAFIFVENDRYIVVLAMSMSVKVLYIRWENRIIGENRTSQENQRSFAKTIIFSLLNRDFVLKCRQKISIFERISAFSISKSSIMRKRSRILMTPYLSGYTTSIRHWNFVVESLTNFDETATSLQSQKLVKSNGNT